MRPWAGLAVAALALAMAPATHAASPPQIRTLSNRADLVSGGDALVEVAIPRGRRAGLRVVAAGRDVTKAFAPRGHRRYVGLVDRLPLGRSSIVVRLADGRRARLWVTNHPREGPVFAGPQTQPWICATNAAGLGPPRDAACSAPTRVKYFYKPTNPLVRTFLPYDPAKPASDVKTTTTPDGRRVPFVVRYEIGTMDRGIYALAVLADAWSGKVLWPFGGDCRPWHQQDVPVDPLGGYPIDVGLADHTGLGLDEALGAIFGNGNAVAALSRGFMVATNSLNKLGSQCNPIVSAEAVMMLKEHIVETYGPIRYAIGAGSSGGSMQQHFIAAAYPGLLDGIQPMASFPDLWTTVQEAEDCHLLNRYFNSAVWLSATQREAVLGTQGSVGCLLQFDGPQLPTPNVGSYSGTWMDPDYAPGCGLPAARVYDADGNRGGVRCTLQDYMVSVLGRRAGDGFANRAYDNVGVQYGLRALRSGAISPEQFVDVNARVGGLDIDWNPVPGRSVADPPALAAAYASGLVSSAEQLVSVPMIDVRGADNFEIHSDFHTYVMRARLDAANGGHANQVSFTGARALLGDPASFRAAFDLIDEWLERIERDGAAGSRAAKVVRNRPARAVDSCWFEGRQVTDASTCAKAFPYHANARIAAGGSLADDVLKCRLHRPLRDDYLPARFTDEQWSRLLAAFPDGVCDYSRRGVAQQPTTPWRSYAEGPGGRPLGEPPRSRALKRRR